MFKKIVIALAITATSMSAFADYDIYLKFNDGSHDVYKNVPDSMTPDQFALTVKQLSGKNFADADLDASMISSAGTVDYSNKEKKKVSFWDTGLGQVTIIVGTVLVLGALFPQRGGSSYKGPCLLPTDRTASGALCGKMAAVVRPGGAF